MRNSILWSAGFSGILCLSSSSFLLAKEVAQPVPVIAGHAVTPEEMRQALVAAGAVSSLSHQYDTQNLGSYPRAGQKRPAGASLFSKDAAKQAGFDPSNNVREVLGGQKGYDYRVHSNSSDPKSFFVELRPADGGEDASSTWLLLKPKPGFDPNAAMNVTPEEQAAASQKLAKISALGGLDSTTPGGTTLGRLLGVFREYGVPFEDLEAALADPKTGKQGDRTAIGNDMVRLHQANQLRPFCSDAVNAALPPTINQDGTKLNSSSPDYAQKLEANQIRNEIFGDNLYGVILSELLLNGKITTADQKVYRTPMEVSAIVDGKLQELSDLRARLHVPGTQALYYDEDKLLSAMTRGADVRRDDLIRKDVLVKFTDLVTPEKGLTVPKFTWGNQVDFMSDGDKAFAQRLKDLAAMTAQARAGKKVTYDFTVWKFYADRPKDVHQLGPKLKQALLDAANAGVETHITVDRSVAKRDPGAMQILSELDAHKNIIVNYFNNDERGTPGDSNHAKSAISNGYGPDANAIVGGRNIHGDYYYEWMDTELRIQGELAQQLQRAEDDMWTQQAKMHGKSDWIRAARSYQLAAKPGYVIGLATHELPGPDSRFNGLIGVLAGLEMADRHYTMIQAYVLPPIPGGDDPTLKAILRAVKSGKSVDIVTNSPATIDTPQISAPIVKYAGHLLDEVNRVRPGSLRVFMKKRWSGDGGATLHAKVAYDDSWYVSDTSNNLHANGFLQHEGQRYYLDDDLNASVRAWGEQLKDPNQSSEYTDSKSLLREQTPKQGYADPALNALLALFPYQL